MHKLGIMLFRIVRGFVRLFRCALPLVGIVMTVLIVTNRCRAADDGPDVSSRESLASRVAALVTELDAQERKRRRSAEQTLVSFGPRVLGLLPSPQAASPAASSAILRIRRRVAAGMVRSELEPSRVTLRGLLTYSELFADLSRQSGNPIDFDSPSGAGRVSVDHESATFWSVLSDLGSRHLLEINATGHGLKIVAAPERTAAMRPFACSGAFAVAVESASLRDIPSTSGGTLLHLDLAVWWEPRLRTLLVRKPPGSLKASTAQGSELKLYTPLASVDLPAGLRASRTTVREDFHIARRAAREPLRLWGQLVAQMAAGRHRFEFAIRPEQPPAASQFGSVTVDVRNMRLEGLAAAGTFDLDVELGVVFSDGRHVIESHRNWIAGNRVHLEDDEGNVIGIAERTTTELTGKRGVAIRCRFDRVPGSPGQHRVVYETPTAVVDVPIEFTFDHVLIPDPSENRREDGTRRRQ